MTRVLGMVRARAAASVWARARTVRLQHEARGERDLGYPPVAAVAGPVTVRGRNDTVARRARP